MFDSPYTVTINALQGKSVFVRDRIYFKFASVKGVKATLRVTFPNEDKRDNYNEEKEKAAQKFKKMTRLHAEIEAQTDELWVKQFKIDDFLANLKKLEEARHTKEAEAFET